MSYPITLVTGAGGSGKTLWVVGEVEKLRLETGRPVYYHHIDEVTLPWIYLDDPHKWVDLPSGAIFVIDEAHKFFPQRGPGAPPAYVEPFGELRHRGYSAFLLSQEPVSLDNFIRKRSNRHVHFKRKFGFEMATMLEWQELGDPNDERSLRTAITRQFRFPKKLYGTYKSADVHTIQKRPPYWKLAPLAVLPLVVLAVVWGIISNFTGSDEVITAPAPAPVAPARPAPVNAYGGPEALAWSQQFRERVRGQPHSAQFYDATLGARVLPKISGCGEVKAKGYYKCFCNTQQGTIITTMTPAECRFYLKNGWFDPTREEEEQDEGGSGSGSRLAEKDLIDTEREPAPAEGGAAAPRGFLAGNR